uniref:DUF834 domain-containing protein n=1 Tax=Oryza glaberrima TaxID=4538 RepID=I1QZV6_ORYGL
MALEEDMRVRNKDEGGTAIDEEPIEDQGGESNKGDVEDALGFIVLALTMAHHRRVISVATTTTTYYCDDVGGGRDVGGGSIVHVGSWREEDKRRRSSGSRVK